MKCTLFIVVVCCLLFGCTGNNKAPFVGSHSAATVQIAIQPIDDLPAARAQIIFKRVKAVYDNCILLPPQAFPKAAWYAPRQRYRADTILKWLSARAAPNQVIAAITTKDISTAKGDIKDFGIMGLGMEPGSACVISTFRLKKSLDDQLYKVVLHELGHTAGLPHCTVKTCLMRDAEGHNTTDEEVEFCPACRKVLVGKGWKL